MTVDEAIEECNEHISEIADATSVFSQAESAEIYEEIASVCAMRARTIRQEMEE